MIIIVDNDSLRRRSICEMLHYMGILSVGACGEEIPNELKERCSAVLFASESALYAAPPMPEVPSYAVSRYSAPGVRRCFYNGESAAEIVAAIRADMQTRGERCIGEYRLGKLNASSEVGGVTYSGVPVCLTRTEAMVLRYLILAYPSAVSAEEILKYAFRSSRLPEVSSVRTHISIMNKKFKKAVGVSLIQPAEKGGYVLSESILTEDISAALVKA